jgi:hypothetical protein
MQFSDGFQAPIRSGTGYSKNDYLVFTVGLVHFHLHSIAQIGILNLFRLILQLKNDFEPDWTTPAKKGSHMERVIIDIPDNKINFFLELVSNLGFKKVQRLSSDQKEFVEGTKKSIEQVEQHLKGDIKLKTADQLFNEL